LLDRVVATGCPATTAWTFDVGDFPLIGRNLVTDGVAFGYAPRRSALDHVLVEAAVDAGAELREGFVVDEFLSDGGRVSGIRGHESGKSVPATERAKVTIGADGRHSLLAKTVNADLTESHPTLTCWYFSYWSGVTCDGLEIYDTGRRVIFAFPTNDDLTGIFVAWPAAELARVRSDIEGSFTSAVDSVPEFSERVRNGRREERFRGATSLPNFLRKPHGPGWALVGDAGCHKDPYMALGVCDAFRDAELLASAIDAGLAGEQPMESALADYERRRNEATAPLFHRNLYSAKFQEPPPELLAIRAAVRDDPEASNQLFLAMDGLIPYESFFNPQNLERLMSGAGIARGRPQA
jgi:flavin-dependent dehydrogenase